MRHAARYSVLLELRLPSLMGQFHGDDSAVVPGGAQVFLFNHYQRRMVILGTGLPLRRVRLSLHTDT